MGLGIADEEADEQQLPATGVLSSAAHSRALSPPPGVGLRDVLVASVLFGAALLTLFGFQTVLHIDIAGVSPAPHFVYQAQSFLRGRWDIHLPSDITDLVMLH